MPAQGLEWGAGRGLGRGAIAVILAGQMDQAIDEHRAGMAALDRADRWEPDYPKASPGAAMILTSC
jgi:hypothetical protein